MEYHTTAVRRSGDGFEVDGDLTIKGVTRPVTLAVEFNGIGSVPVGRQAVGIVGAWGDQPRRLRDQFQRAARGGRGDGR